jgi:hypothetical protein
MRWLQFFQVAGRVGGFVAQVDPDRNVEDELPAGVERAASR